MNSFNLKLRTWKGTWKCCYTLIQSYFWLLVLYEIILSCIKDIYNPSLCSEVLGEIYFYLVWRKTCHKLIANERCDIFKENDEEEFE